MKKRNLFLGFNFHCHCDLLFIDAPVSDRQYLFSNTTSDRKKCRGSLVIFVQETLQTHYELPEVSYPPKLLGALTSGFVP